MAPLRVCFYVFFPGGGIGRYTRELVAALADTGTVNVEVACTPEYAWRDELNSRPILRSISHPSPYRRRIRFLVGQFANPLRCIAHARRAGVNVIHFSNVNHMSFPLWRQALHHSGIRTVISVHDVTRQKRILNRRWEDAQLKAIYRYSDALFVHSEYQSRELRDWAAVDPGRIHVVPHGPYAYGVPGKDRQTLRQEMRLPVDEQVALFFGQIRDEKNLGGLMRAMASQDARFHLLVAGKSSDRHKGAPFYRELAEALGISERVHFKDRYIDDSEVPDLFEVADWVALPYLNTFTSQSGVMNIATQYDRPVLVSSSPVLAETVSKYDIGIVANGDGPEALAEGIQAIVRRAHLGNFAGFNSYRNNSSWNENARLSLQVYKSVLGYDKSEVA